MSSSDSKAEVATQQADEALSAKDKASGDAKSDTSPHKRSASELNSADDEVKQKIQKTDHRGEKKEKENGESEDKFDEADDDEGADDDDEEGVAEGGEEDYDDDPEGDGEGDEDGAEEDDDDDDDA